jgi:hypothetical protein
MTVTDDPGAAEKATEGAGQKQEQKTFTQVEVDALIKDRAERLAKQQYPDYEELKTKAAGAKTLEERLGSLEQELSATKAVALRTGIAAKFGISTESKDGELSDADLFLTGTDEATLTAQAQRLAARQADSKKNGNVAPSEGGTKSTGKDNGDLREFARELFARAE